MVLGLIGNPLSKDIMNIYAEPNGTQKLLTFMLDNLQGKKNFLYLRQFLHKQTMSAHVQLRCFNVAFSCGLGTITIAITLIFTENCRVKANHKN